MMPRSWHHRPAGGKGKRSDGLSRSLSGRRLPNATLARASANYGRQAPTGNAFLTRKGASAGKGRCRARMGGSAGIGPSRTRTQRLNRAQLNETVLAVPIAQADGLFAKLDTLLPEKPHSCTGFRVWGDEPADDIQVSFDERYLEEIQARFDAGEMSLPLIRGVCDLTRHFAWVFAGPEGGIIQPSRETVIRTVLQSGATHFVQDPRVFIEDAVRRDREDQ
jgi:hypothetical protein